MFISDYIEYNLMFLRRGTLTDMISAIEEQEVGWPELLAWVILMEWILSLWARSWSSWCWFSADIILTDR
mgnify:CR=1 FL=1